MKVQEMISASPGEAVADCEAALDLYRSLLRVRSDLLGMRGRLPRRGAGPRADDVHQPQRGVRQRVRDDGSVAQPDGACARTRGAAPDPASGVRRGLQQMR